MNLIDSVHAEANITLIRREGGMLTLLAYWSRRVDGVDPDRQVTIILWTRNQRWSHGRWLGPIVHSHLVLRQWGVGPSTWSCSSINCRLFYARAPSFMLWPCMDITHATIVAKIALTCSSDVNVDQVPTLSIFNACLVLTARYINFL